MSAAAWASSRPGGIRSAVLALTAAIVSMVPASGALAQTATPPAQAQAPSAWRVTVSNLTRVESWRFFEPAPAGGDPDYAFIANRLRVTATLRRPRFDLSAAGQYGQFGGLPSGASGPGALGTGALYFQHAGSPDSRGLYLRTLDLRVRLPRGVTLQGGRFAYTSGAEAPSGRPKIEAVKRARVDSRLVGEFEWSIYQRSFDGVRSRHSRHHRTTGLAMASVEYAPTTNPTTSTNEKPRSTSPP